MTQLPRAAAWVRSPWRWLAIAAAGAAVCAWAYTKEPRAIVESYWMAVVGWTGLSVGALGILLIHGLVGGRWGQLLGPPLAAATRPLWLMAALFVPVFLRLSAVFPWARSEQASAAVPAAAQSGYLQVEWFQLRGACYWGIWLLLAILVPLRSTGETDRYASRLGAIGLPLLVLAVTFASIDWMMSLEPPWSSPAYGVLVLAGQGASAFAFAIVVAAVSLGDRPLSQASSWPWHDAGNLLLAAVCFWMYIAFSQFLIVWSGNLPEEIPWYLTRARSPWRTVAVVLAALHFAVPFGLLLSRKLKRNPRALALVAALVLAMHAVDVWWLVAPAFGRATPAGLGCDALAFITVGAMWLVVYALRPPVWPAESHEPAVTS